MTQIIKSVDVCCGLSWGDEAKGKVIAYLAKTRQYDFVCRWAGGQNAGHTVYVNGKKYKTHIVPSGIFYNVQSIIGPDCVINRDNFQKELDYLKENGFNTDLVKVSPKTHIVTNQHIEEDIVQYKKQQGSTAQGIAPCYRDKYARKGVRAGEDDFFQSYLWDEVLYGNILCEGAQGFWLDINYGNYPFVTSSTTLPYGACSLGFPPQMIETIYGVSKIYDTRAGLDDEFPESLLEDPELSLIAKEGNEFGTTTGRLRKVNWLNMDKLIQAVNVSGTTDIVISKIDILEKVKLYKIIHENKIKQFENMIQMKEFIDVQLRQKCRMLKRVVYSGHVEHVDDL